MSWRPNVVRSLGLDQGHHEELRNGPEIKNHIRESLFWVSEKFEIFPASYRKILESSGGSHCGAHLSRRAYLRPRSVPLVHVASPPWCMWLINGQPIKGGVTTFERRRLPLFKEMGGYHLGDEVVGCPKPPYIKRGRGLNVPS